MNSGEHEEAQSHTPSNDRMSEVLRLTAALCNQALDAQIMQRPVPEDQVRALASAARLLREHDVEWPPMLTQVLHELALNVDRDEPPYQAQNDEAGTSSKVTSLKRFLGSFRREKGEP